MKRRQVSKGPKQPRPFFRKFTQSYYLQIDGRQICLGRDERAAWEEYHRIMASREGLASPALPVWKFVEAYLDWVEHNKAPATYKSAVHYLSSFVAFLGKRKQLRHVAVDDVKGWLKRMRDPNRKREKPSRKPWGSTTQSDAVSYVRRAFVWGERKKLVNSSPVAGWENAPSRKRREVTYSTAEWERIVSHADSASIRL